MERDINSSSINIKICEEIGPRGETWTHED